jgi:hypothetical protein
MNHATLYEDDIYAWSQEQARIIRDLGHRRFDLPNDLDLEHVAEEIEDVGNEQRYAAESNLIQALIHLVKLAVLPESETARHWLKETNGFLATAARRYRPSMRRAIDVQKLWDSAKRRAGRDLEIDGHSVPALPAALPFTLEELVSEATDPRSLMARLAASAGGPKDDTDLA